MSPGPACALLAASILAAFNAQPGQRPPGVAAAPSRPVGDVPVTLIVFVNEGCPGCGGRMAAVERRRPPALSGRHPGAV